MSLVAFLIIISIVYIGGSYFICNTRFSKVLIPMGVAVIFLWFVAYDSATATHEHLKFSDDYSLVSTSTIDIPNGASIYLSSGYTSYITSTDNIFVLTENTTIESLEEFLGSTKKNVYFCVKEGTEVVFNYNFGLCDFTDASNILESYNNILEDDGVVSSVYRYTIFKIFYYDKEVVSNVYK